MKKRITSLILILMVGMLGFSACDKDDGVSSGSIIGSYVLNYMLDKLTGTTYYAGQPTSVEGMEITMTGQLTLTDNTYSMSFTTSANFFGETFTDTFTETGTYTTSGNSMTATPSDGSTPETFTYSLTSTQLILENDEMKNVFDKQ